MNTEIIDELEEIIEDRELNPKPDSYVSSLLRDKNRLLEKIGEESTETIIAAKENENIIHEIADLFFHLLILTKASDASFEEVLDELEKRRRN